MFNFSSEPWSSNPYAPGIPYSLYLSEKAGLAGIFIGSTLYGVVITLFFRCLGVLFSPANYTRDSTKWGLIVHTTVVFSLTTITTAMNLSLQSISYIDNLAFYDLSVYSKAIYVVPNIPFVLNNWLADGLLLYRCYVVYVKNYWVAAFPCLMYLASLVLGVVLIYYEITGPNDITWVLTNFGTPYFWISLSLNVLLTLLIVIRLIIHKRNTRIVSGGPLGTNGLYKALIITFTESCTLYAAAFLLFVGPWCANSWAMSIFFPILIETQSIAQFLIILRIANRRALTSNSIAPGNSDSPHFRSQEKSNNIGETVSDSLPGTLMDGPGEIPSRVGDEAEAIASHWTGGASVLPAFTTKNENQDHAEDLVISPRRL